MKKILFFVVTLCIVLVSTSCYAFQDSIHDDDIPDDNETSKSPSDNVDINTMLPTFDSVEEFKKVYADIPNSIYRKSYVDLNSIISNEEVKKINEWQETPGAGYVYIISNVGSFGEDVFKIGVTRRDDPEIRVRELSSASVPFNFDTHVFIFSKNAYELENELHKRFDKRRVNKINMRKEFFHISIDEVKQIVEENKGAVHSFVEKPDAEEYYETLIIEEKMSS